MNLAEAPEVGTSLPESVIFHAPHSENLDLKQQVAELSQLRDRICAVLHTDPGDLIFKLEQLVNLSDDDTEILESLLDLLRAETYADILPAVRQLTNNRSDGRLALLQFDGDMADLTYLEPYVRQGEAQAMTINQVQQGISERCLLVLALYEASRSIQHAPICPAQIHTLFGD